MQWAQGLDKAFPLIFISVTRFKTIFFWTFVAAAIGFGVYAYLGLKNNKRPQLNALSVLPDSCLVYLNSSDFSELNIRINERSLIADKLKLFKEVKQLCLTLQLFDSLASSNEGIKNELDKNLIHFAYYEKPATWLLTFNIRQLGKQDAVESELEDLFHSRKSGDNLQEFKLSGSTLFLTLSDGVVLLTNQRNMIGKALNAKMRKFETSLPYANFKSTLNEHNVLSVYVNQSLYRQSEARKQLDLCPAIERGSSAGAIEILPSQLKINGFAIPDSTDLMASLLNQEAQESEDLISLLPATSIWFRAYGFNSFEKLRGQTRSSDSQNEFWKRKNQQALFNLEKEFYNNTGNHVLDIDLGVPGNAVGCVAVQDSVKAQEHLKLLADSTHAETNPAIFEISETSKLYWPYSEVDFKYVVRIGNHLYFSGSYAELSEAVSALKNGDLLATNESFLLYKKQYFADEYNYLLYCSPEQFKGRSDYFNFHKETGERSFENFRHLSLSLAQEKGQFKFRFHLLNESEKRTKEQNILWTLQLDTLCKSSAWPFVNHTTGENELVVQDENNALYLINAKGTVLWKKQLEEKILSPIYTVDIYKNKKYQMLFNGKRHLHLIDRNGNYVEKYPVKLAADASSPLALFDYDLDKEYRLFIACANKTIYNYSIHGEKQEKFVPVKTEDEVTLPIQYLKVGASDYLVALDKEGKIYTFSRKGAGRIGLRNRTVANCTIFYTDAANSVSNTRLIYVDDKNGIVSKIFFDDKKEISKLVSDIENASVVFTEFDDNRSMDLLLAKGRDVFAFDFSGNLLFEKSAPFDLKVAHFFGDESHSVVYALDEAEEQLILFDLQKQNSKILKANSMPLVSNLFNDNKKYLILNQGNKLSCILLN